MKFNIVKLILGLTDFFTLIRFYSQNSWYTDGRDLARRYAVAGLQAVVPEMVVEYLGEEDRRRDRPDGAGFNAADACLRPGRTYFREGDALPSILWWLG